MNRKYWLRIVYGALVLGVLYLFGYILERRAFGYGYNVKADYAYRFDTVNAKIVTAVEKDGYIEIPKFETSYNTALLEVSLKPCLMSYFSQPEIRLKQNSTIVSEYFECRARGIRYVNITEFLRNEAKKIKADCYRCEFQKHTFRLILFKNLDIRQESVLILSPHPDDAEIAAFGLYSSSKHAFLATITAGDAGKRKYDQLHSNDSTHYLKKGEMRVWNSLTVPLLGGLSVQNVVNLGYFDGTLKTMHDSDKLIVKSRFIGIQDINIFRSKNLSTILDSVKATATWHSLVNDLKVIILKKQPTILITPSPLIDFHNDHKFTTIALLQAMHELNYTKAELWMYTNHYAKPDYYPIGKWGSAISLPPYFHNKPMYFQKIYSHSLSKEDQIDKLYALDAMNDLRLNAEWHSTSGLYKVLKDKITDKFYNEEFDYFRRSVRSNELFFVICAPHVFDYEAMVIKEMDDEKNSKAAQSCLNEYP
jgi:LmbE family N-acetylglucosaminyl deacetylase